MLDCASLTTTSKYHQPQDEVLIGINFGLPKPQDAKVRMESALLYMLRSWSHRGQHEYYTTPPQQESEGASKDVVFANLPCLTNQESARIISSILVNRSE